jgi:hypothetical protein
MANPVLSTQNLTQFEKDFFITEAVISLDTVNAGLMYVADGVKNDKYTFPVLSTQTVLQPRSLFPTPKGTTTLSNKDVTLGAFENYDEFDPTIFENHWHQSQLTDKLLSRNLPTTFANYLGTYYTAKTFVPIENMIHIGSTTYTASAGVGQPNANHKFFDGVIKQAITGGALQVASPSVITSANIIAKMEAAKNSLPIALLAKANRYQRLKYIMSVVDAQKYEDALTNTSFKNNDTTEKGLNKYKGYEIVVCAGVPENTFYFCEATTDIESNLQLCVTSLDNISFEINRVQNNSVAHFYKAILKMGVGIAKPNEFAIHTTKVAADFNA